MTPTEWFDQFPPLAEGKSWPEDGQWCARHWAPCPLLGANGVGATLELMQMFLQGLHAGGDTAQMNAALEAAGHLCCALGDDRMYELWGHWPPPPSEAT